MHLQQLFITPHVSVQYDTWNNWLFVEWLGELTLPALKHACLAVARCFLTHQYARVLNSDVFVTHMGWDITDWLGRNLFPYLRLAGVTQLAWVYAPTLKGRDIAEQICQQLPPQLEVSLFSDIEQAVTWLQQTGPAYNSGCAYAPRLASNQVQLAQLVQHFEEHLWALPCL